MENEGLPHYEENPNGRYLRQFFYIIAITLLLGGTFQFLGISLVTLLYGFDLTQIEAILGGSMTGNEYHGALYILLAFNALSFLAPALILPKILKEEAKEFLQVNNWARPRLYLLAAVLLLVAQPFITLLVEFNESLFNLSGFSSYKAEAEAREKEIEAIFLPLLTKGGVLYFIINLFIFAILPAVSEEFLFRGVIQKHLYNWSGKIHLAVFLAGMIFSIFHLQWMGFIPRLLLGMALGYLVVYSGTIWVSILAHAVNNSLAVIQHYPWSGGKPALFREDFDMPYYYGLISLLLAAAVFYLIQKFRTRPEEIPA